MRRVIEMSRRGKAVALVAVLCAGGCYEADFPLDSAPQVAVDAALLGSWRCLSFDAGPQERPATVVVESPRERVYGLTLQEDGKGPEHYEAHASSVRIPRLLNIQELKDGVARIRAYGGNRDLALVCVMPADIGPHARERYIGVFGEDHTLLSGSVTTVAQMVEEFEAAGVHHLVCSFRDVRLFRDDRIDEINRQMRLFVNEVLPSFAG